MPQKKESKTILIVDDSVILLQTVRDLLEQVGYHVITAQSAPEALQKLEKTRIDLALIDIIMPTMSGFDLTSKIRGDKKFRNLKIAYLTVLSFSEQQKKNLEKFNVLDYIQKPFNSDDLIKRVKSILNSKI